MVEIADCIVARVFSILLSAELVLSKSGILRMAGVARLPSKK
jgi:hypothetical protein